MDEERAVERRSVLRQSASRLASFMVRGDAGSKAWGGEGGLKAYFGTRILM